MDILSSRRARCSRSFFPSALATPLLDAFCELWEGTRPAFRQERVFRRARDLAAAALLCPSRRTITNLLCTQGRQGSDWSADYRVLQRLDAAALFDPVLAAVSQAHPSGHRVLVSLDTTLLRKTGRKVAGTVWRRDPLGPKFQTNLVWAQRFLQASAVLPESFEEPCRARAVPIALHHCPGVKNKPPKEATVEQLRAHRKTVRDAGAPAAAAEQIAQLRARIDATEGGCDRTLLCAVDNGLTNAAVLRGLPERTHLVGRLRGSAVLWEVPAAEAPHAGRPRLYGGRLNTPDEMRRDENRPWRTVPVFVGGALREVRVKTTGAVRWQPAGPRDVQVVIIAPVPYKLSPNAPRNWRDPAYLICTDPCMDPREVVQCYVHRWEIEVNFRDEKTLLGAGEAQVRRADSCENAPALLVAAYASLLLAAEKTRRDRTRPPMPKWREGAPPPRETTQQMIAQLRAEILRAELDALDKQGLAAKMARAPNTQKLAPSYIMAPLFLQK